MEHDWEIISYDFPQSGTGKYLHPNVDDRKEKTKNHKAFIPDIIAVKKETALFFENKNRFYLDDFIKIKSLKNKNIYSNAINKLLENKNIKNIYYGIGAIDSKHFIENANIYKCHVDFIVVVGNNVEFLVDGFEL